MLFSTNGPDFLRLQTGSAGYISDEIHPSVYFSGGFDDGMGFKYSSVLSGNGIGGSDSATINISGGDFTRPALVFASLRLTANCIQNGETLYATGEILPPMGYSYYAYNVGQRYRYSFKCYCSTTQLFFQVSGFSGVATAILMDVA